jgi:predicted NAD/FAD-binding protein
VAAVEVPPRHDVEREVRIGGHSNTVEASSAGPPVPLDTGFIVYNEVSYPNLVALFEHLAVPTAQSDMSFAVSFDGGRYECSGCGLTGLFGQPANLLRPSHWRMAADRGVGSLHGLVASFPDNPRGLSSQWMRC